MIVGDHKRFNRGGFSYTPWKQTCPPKLDGWKETFSFDLVSFLGSMLNFGGVLFLSYIKPGSFGVWWSEDLIHLKIAGWTMVGLDCGSLVIQHPLVVHLNVCKKTPCCWYMEDIGGDILYVLYVYVHWYESMIYGCWHPSMVRNRNFLCCMTCIIYLCDFHEVLGW